MPRNNVKNVQNWRRRSKERIVAAMGGCCQICGYRKCTSALALHHIDPSQKDFSFGRMRAHPKAWIKIVVELRKCVLLCHNCHSELHDGVVELPKKFSSFDERFVDYKNMPL